MENGNGKARSEREGGWLRRTRAGVGAANVKGAARNIEAESLGSGMKRIGLDRPLVTMTNSMRDGWMDGSIRCGRYNKGG